MGNAAVYKQIVHDVKEKIISGELQQGCKLESDSVYAERYKVSRNTIIKAFDILRIEGWVTRIQGGSSYVSAKKAVTPSSDGELYQTKIISLVLPLLANNILHSGEYSLVCGIEEVLRENRYNLLISKDTEYSDEQASFISSSRQKNSCGTIIYPTIAGRVPVDLFKIIMDDFPVVFIDRKNGFKNIPCIQSDNEKGGSLAARHLIECGYTDLYYICDSTVDVTQTLRDRFIGFGRELRKSGFEIDENHLIQGFSLKNEIYIPTTYETNPILFRNMVKDVSSSNKGRIGIFACNDAVAYSIIRAAHDLDIPVPEKIGVVGFDDANYAQATLVPITTIRQDFMKIGKTAAKTMMSILHGERVSPDIVIDVELVIRNSTSI